MLKYFFLQRNVDHSGNSGTGRVAHVFAIEGFGALLVWDGNNAAKTQSVVVYFSLDDLIAIHGHSGDTVLVEQDISEIDLSEIFEVVDKAQENYIAINLSI